MGAAPQPAMEATRALALRSAGLRLGDLSPAVVDAALRSLADALALGLYGATEPCVTLLAAALGESGLGGKATAFAGGHRWSCEQAALLNGTAIHAIDYDDTFGPGLAHLTGAVLPAALAVAEARGRSGAALLAAYIAGYDAAAQVALLSGPTAVAAQGFHPTGCFGTYGAAVAAAHLLEADATAMQSALGLAATQAAGLMANNGTMAKPLQAGKAAANGLLAARLATRGFTAGTTALSGASGARSYADQPAQAASPEVPPPGTALCQTTLKPYPSCWLTHGTVEAAIALRGRLGRAPCVGIEIAVTPYALGVCDRPAPRSGLDAKFSLQYVARLALRSGAVTLDDFARIAEPQSPPVTLLADDSLAGNAAAVTLQIADGSRLTERCAEPLGSPGRPLDRRDLAGKVGDLLAARGRAAEAERLLDLVHGLPAAPSVDALIRFIAKAGS